MNAAEISELKNKTTVSIIFLSLRNFGIQGISIVGFFLLTIILGRGDVGLFAIVAESVGILGYFSDIGLASALIQQKDKPNDSELQTTFVIQQLLVIIALVVVAIIYPKISIAKAYGSKELWILISLCFSFAVASLKTIPSILLERNLNFKLLSTIDIVENTTFYFFAVLFAFLGYGVFSYAIATFIRSFLGLIVIYHYSPWPIGFSFSLPSAKKLFKYGIPFQFNSFIAVAKDRLSNLLVAGIIGRDSFGIISWAQKGPRIPLSFMDAIMRVTFPTFSRIQDQKEFLKKSIEKSIYFIALFVFPTLAGISAIALDIINIIPKYSQWLPAIIPMYIFAVNAAIASVTTPLTNAFNAVGKISITTKLMIMWTILTWIFYPLLSLKFGYMGTAAATLIVGSSSIVVWIVAKKVFLINVFQVILHPFMATLLMSVAIWSINLIHFNSIINIVTKIIVGIVVYLAYCLYFSKNEIYWFLAQAKWLQQKK
ncbi:MAG: oligosaccharide flippase family protein [Candidatus Shapirobacteria bacterium]